MDVDDMLTQAQDALFDNNVPEAIRICKEVLKSKPREGDAYCLLRSLYVQQNDYKQASETTKMWGAKCGYTAAQLRAQAESAFIIGDTEAVADAGRRLVNGRFKEPVGVFVKMLVAALCADIKESAITNSLFGACEDEKMEEEDEEIVDIFTAWAEIRSGNDRYVYGMQMLEKCVSTPNIHFRGFASALMALEHMKESKFPEAEAIISKPEFTPDDANIASARALLAIAKNGNTTKDLEKKQEWIRDVDKGLTGGSNIILRRRLIQAVDEGKGGGSVAGR